MNFGFNVFLVITTSVGLLLVLAYILGLFTKTKTYTLFWRGLVVLYVGFSIFLVGLFNEYIGYPSGEYTGNIRYIYHIIRYPDKQKKDPGGIFIWGIDEEYKSNLLYKWFGIDLNKPRSFELPFSLKNKKKLEKARKRAKLGYKVKINIRMKGQNRRFNDKTLFIRYIDPRKRMGKLPNE